MTAPKKPRKRDRLIVFATVRHWLSQLNGSGVKHDVQTGSGTRNVYLFQLEVFDSWLAGRPFDVRVQTVVDGRITRETVTKSFPNVEELLYFGEDGNEKEVKKIISEYLADPQNAHVKQSTRAVMCAAIKSYFDTHDVFTNVRVNGRKQDDGEFDDEPGLDIVEFYKMMTAGKLNPLTRAVMMVKFQAGLDSSTLADRFSFYAYSQIAKHCGTDDYKKWDPKKCPIPIRLIRVKTTTKYTTFIDRDALSAIKEYLEWKEKLRGPHDPKGPMFVTSRDQPVHVKWVSSAFGRIAKTSGVQKQLSDGTSKVKSHGVRHLLKSTLKACGCMDYAADHIIGHAPKDPYDQGAKYYPETLRLEYAKASHKINIFSRVQSVVDDPEPPGGADEKLNDALAKIEAMSRKINEMQADNEKKKERGNGSAAATNAALLELFRKLFGDDFDGDMMNNIMKRFDGKK